MGNLLSLNPKKQLPGANAEILRSVAYCDWQVFWYKWVASWCDVSVDLIAQHDDAGFAEVMKPGKRVASGRRPDVYNASG